MKRTFGIISDLKFDFRSWLLLLMVVPLLLTGCLSRKTVIPVDERLLPAQSMTRAEILQKLEDRSRSVQTVNATVTLDAAGGELTGVLTEYRQTRGILLVERPNQIRIKAQMPLVLATVFDMVSNGSQYRVYIPPKNKFAIGDADAPAKSENPVLNLRPTHVMEALFVDILPYLDDTSVRSTLEQTTQGQRSYYVVGFVSLASPEAQLLEKIWIDRSTLEISRKEIFGEDGRLETHVEFAQYAMVGDVLFPQYIAIRRPIEDYSLTLTFGERTVLNQPLTPNAFELERPSGAEVVQLDADGPGL